MKELVSMVRVWHSEGEKGGFVDTIPLPVEIESAIPASPDCQLTSPEDEEKFNALASNNQRVVVIGNGNLRLISEELSKSIFRIMFLGLQIKIKLFKNIKLIRSSIFETQT